MAVGRAARIGGLREDRICPRTDAMRPSNVVLPVGIAACARIQIGQQTSLRAAGRTLLGLNGRFAPDTGGLTAEPIRWNLTKQSAAGAADGGPVLPAARQPALARYGAVAFEPVGEIFYQYAPEGMVFYVYLFNVLLYRINC